MHHKQLFTELHQQYFEITCPFVNSYKIKTKNHETKIAATVNILLEISAQFKDETEEMHSNFYGHIPYLFPLHLFDSMNEQQITCSILHISKLLTPPNGAITSVKQDTSTGLKCQLFKNIY